MGKLRYLKGVVTLNLFDDRCTGCGMCVCVCPHEVYELTRGKASIIDRDACMECGACALNCPADAIEVSKGVGCAAAVLEGAIRGTEPQCCCGGAEDPSCGQTDGQEGGAPNRSCC